MVTTPFNPSAYSKLFLLRLCRVITDEHGAELHKLDFTDIVLGMIEDVAGFETMSPEETDDLIDKLWRTYRGKD
jgi:hypothetical protein